MKDLITRLREGDGPDRFLDADICLFFKYPNGMANNADPVRRHGKHGKLEFRYRVGGNSFFQFAPNLTASIDACLALVGQVLPGWRWVIHSPRSGLKYGCSVANPNPPRFHRTGEHESSAYRAMLMALLEAHEAQQADMEVADG